MGFFVRACNIKKNECIAQVDNFVLSTFYVYVTHIDPIDFQEKEMSRSFFYSAKCLISTLFVA